jgi:hypothetical protein
LTRLTLIDLDMAMRIRLVARQDKDKRIDALTSSYRKASPPPPPFSLDVSHGLPLLAESSATPWANFLNLAVLRTSLGHAREGRQWLRRAFEACPDPQLFFASVLDVIKGGGPKALIEFQLSAGDEKNDAAQADDEDEVSPTGGGGSDAAGV